jgi:hypothetical protein
MRVRILFAALAFLSLIDTGCCCWRPLGCRRCCSQPACCPTNCCESCYYHGDGVPGPLVPVPAPSPVIVPR